MLPSSELLLYPHNSIIVEKDPLWDLHFKTQSTVWGKYIWAAPNCKKAVLSKAPNATRAISCKTWNWSLHLNYESKPNLFENSGVFRYNILPYYQHRNSNYDDKNVCWPSYYCHGLERWYFNWIWPWVLIQYSDDNLLVWEIPWWL